MVSNVSTGVRNLEARVDNTARLSGNANPRRRLLKGVVFQSCL